MYNNKGKNNAYNARPLSSVSTCAQQANAAVLAQLRKQGKVNATQFTSPTIATITLQRAAYRLALAGKIKCNNLDASVSYTTRVYSL